jgi:alanine racemase
VLPVTRPVWAEIDLRAIAHNLQAMKQVTSPATEIMAVVKANAYGHGILEVSRVALTNGAKWLGVAILDEALLLRQHEIKAPILVLGYTGIEQAETVVRAGVTQAVYTFSQAKALSAAAVKLGLLAVIHLKIDTGMGRLGFLPSAATLATIEKIADLPGLVIGGIFTHFAAADAPDKTYTREQFRQFQALIQELEWKGIKPPLKHAANSAAFLDLPETHLDLVRLGIVLYGLYPSPEVRQDLLCLQPAMTVKARVSFVKELPAGWNVSYGRTYTTAGPTAIATIPMGYADGYSRLFSNRGEVLIRGIRVPVVGRVCMDQFMVDVSAQFPVVLGDEVVIFGRQNGSVLTVEELAAKIGTINYELICMISERVPRIYIW